jgi:catalase (peroxidase I)
LAQAPVTNNPQYENGTGTAMTMMLPADWGMLNYSNYYTHVDRYYTQPQSVFFTEFKAAWEKLITQGMADTYANAQFTTCTAIPTTTSVATTGDTSSAGVLSVASVAVAFAIASVLF